jgi:hypothetical protein
MKSKGGGSLSIGTASRAMIGWVGSGSRHRVKATRRKLCHVAVARAALESVKR